MSNPSGPDENDRRGADDATDPGERRFTAPSPSDAGETQVIGTFGEPATEVFSAAQAPNDLSAASAFTEPIAQQNAPGPQVIPGRTDVPKPPKSRRSWGWVIAVLLVIAAVVAVAILGTILLTRDDEAKVSQEDQVRSTIQDFDTAIQKGDLATLRSITCGDTAVSYVDYDDAKWKDIHAKVAAARQYPVVASIDEVVVNGSHAEANVTSFMAFDPATRSTRSFDLEFRDEQWKVCQAPQ
ncbi:hypothetical protein MARA_32870 [Mycolicibacterium arabiense]|uniref:DUF4878 domain-containing protein n=1 Tax=Mycolicibacterium arabiense TaxID=1286181 RepID=A0A7I7S0U3_9MYCO|nr:DUF4878 domain-containing protein [Mycolicibacterium arabiense]MCV7371129.1 DUF4878 domain-containing protein [Mycolicibacterium arabiense]BBY49819.1 hypothetical protein MARA_32870 [Mycolicibacterium arabiense]